MKGSWVSRVLSPGGANRSRRSLDLPGASGSQTDLGSPRLVSASDDALHRTALGSLGGSATSIGSAGTAPAVTSPGSARRDSQTSLHRPEESRYVRRRGRSEHPRGGANSAKFPLGRFPGLLRPSGSSPEVAALERRWQEFATSETDEV